MIIRFTSRLALATLLLIGTSVALLAQAPPHESFTIDSRALGEPRPINVYLPRAYRASDNVRLPLLYMPDGGIDEDFAHMATTVDSLIARYEMEPVILVGIPNTQRRRDLTGPTRVASDSAIAPTVGGSAAFRAFIRDELMPAVAARYRTTRERAIIGESLAGLFIVETFLLEPTLFDHYIAFDPSLWWNGGALVDSASAQLAAMPRLPQTLQLASSGEAMIGKEVARFASILAKAPLAPPFEWTHEERPDLTHATIFRALKAPALLVVFADDREIDR